MKSFDPFSYLESSEDDEDEEQILDYAEQKPKKKGLRTECAFYEQKLMTKPKGSYEVYKTNFSVGEHFNTPVYLHVVQDSKVVYRISTKYAAKPSVPLSIVVKVKNKKSKVTAQTSEAHKTFRNQLGHNDQSDGKRALIGLSSRYYKRWPQKPFAKNWEDGLINSYLNYLLDPGCPTESQNTQLFWFVQEAIDAGEDMRKYRTRETGFKRSQRRASVSQRPVPGSDEILKIGAKCKGGKYALAIKKLQLKGVENVLFVGEGKRNTSAVVPVECIFVLIFL